MLLEALRNFPNLEQQQNKKALVLVQNYIRSSRGTEPVRKFRDCGGLDKLILVLKSSDVELLDLGLSIVATCCREQAARIRVSLLLFVVTDTCDMTRLW